MIAFLLLTMSALSSLGGTQDQNVCNLTLKVLVTTIDALQHFETG